MSVTRLHHLAARNLGCSRAEATRLIEEARLAGPAGERLDPRAKVAGAVPARLDDEPLTLHEHFHLMLHKPLGRITALRDERHPTAYALLTDAPLHGELRAAGRLDLDTTGLLVWTTDGAWLQRITHPKRAVPRTYHAALARPFQADTDGLVLEDGHRPNVTHLAPMDPDACHPALARPAEATTYATITIVGGAYHEVRRIFAALGSHVLALCRVSFGRLALPADLPPGAWRAIDPSDV